MVEQLPFYVATHRDAIIAFLRDLVAIPSCDGIIRDVAARVELL
jgi:hypothetical protein